MGAVTRTLLALIFLIIVATLLMLYWFVPLSTTEFRIKSEPSNFSIREVDLNKVQFYPNMRFPENRISYQIANCPLNKKQNMIDTFNVISNKTSLKFYWNDNDPEISITCDSKVKIEGELIIAGEGGPTNITKSGEFNVITKGKILLLRESNCPNPNIGIHELLHVLGFDHVDDPTDVLYPVTGCDQEIKPYVINTINTLYSIPGYSDLIVEEASALMHGKYLDVNVTIRNSGLKASTYSQVKIYADLKLIKEYNLEPLDIGHGRILSVTNLWVAKIDTNQLKIVIVHSADELKKENNEIVLEIKN